MRSRSRLRFRALAAVLAGLTVLACAQPAFADDPSYPAANPDPVAGYGEPPAGQVITDIKVVTGSDPSVACPAGYTKRYPDLNRGLGTQLNGKLSDYVFTCLLWGPSSSPGLGELYVSSPVTAGCNGDDRQIAGDLNSGMVNFDVDPEEELYYCVHTSGTAGGSGFVVNPGYGVDYFATPETGRLRDVQFLAWDATAVPTCPHESCGTVSLDGPAYLFAAETIDPYCQSYFGASYHPMFQPWEYQGNIDDPHTGVVADSNTWDLNAGVLGKTRIYGCVSYTTDPPTTPNTVTLTLPPARTGQLITLKALVDPTDGGGTVRFTSDGATIPGCGATGFGSGGGTTWQALCSTAALPAGDHTIVATYSGDTSYASSTGQSSISVSAVPNATSVRFVLSTNPRLSLGVAGTVPGSAIVRSTSTGDDTTWVLVPSGSGLELINKRTSLCMTTDGIAGHPLYQTACIGVAAQLWQTSSGIRNPATGMWADTSTGTAVVLAVGTGTSSGQTFHPSAP